MAKQKTIFTCQNCGAQSPKWLGRCADCGQWNSFVEETYAAPASAGAHSSVHGVRPTSSDALIEALGEKSEELKLKRYGTGFAELDRVLGGGLVEGSLTLIGGEPGIGKSTLLLQAVSSLATSAHPLLYVSAEESVRQIQSRATRLGLSSPHVQLASETNMLAILGLVEKHKPKVLIVDSIQTVYMPELQSAPGSVGQVRECSGRLMLVAKTWGVSVIVVGHITKDGSLAGPKVLEHMVDTVLSFEGDGHHQFRILRSIKNRFGPAGEMGVFSMTGRGLEEVFNPSEIFLSPRQGPAIGSAIFCALEGTRPFLVEVQALATRTPLPMPRRTALGIDPNRLHLLLAVLDKHWRLELYSHDVFVNIAGGLRLTEPAVDLAVAAAILSSVKEIAVPQRTCFVGEIGLTGEARPVTFAEVRIKEAIKLGFETVVLPSSQKLDGSVASRLRSVENIRDLASFLDGGASRHRSAQIEQ